MEIKNVKVVLIIVLVLASLPMMYAAAPKSGDASFLQVTLVSQTPDPVEPGSDTEVRLKIENLGGENAEDVELEFVPLFPFSIATNEQIKFLGSIHGRQTGDVGKIEKFNVRVHKNANDGENDVIFRYRSKNNPTWIELDPFTINVRTKEALLSVVSVISDPVSLKPGAIGTVNILLKNLAASKIRNVRVALDLNGVPLAAVGSSNEKTINSIDPGQQKIISIDLMAEGEADSKVYKVPLLLQYSDWTGNEFTKNVTTGLVVGDKPDLRVIIESSEITTAGTAGLVSIRFVNKGTEDIKFLNVLLEETDDFELLSSAEQYVGNVDSDDYETAEFNLYVKPTRKTALALPITIEFNDANNNAFSRSVILEHRLYSASEAKKRGLMQGSSAIGILIILVIVGAGIWFFLKWRKKHLKKK